MLTLATSHVSTVKAPFTFTVDHHKIVLQPHMLHLLQDFGLAVAITIGIAVVFYCFIRPNIRS